MTTCAPPPPSCENPDIARIDVALTDVDVTLTGDGVTLINRLSGDSIGLGAADQFEFLDQTLSLSDLTAQYGPGAPPAILVSDGTQLVTVNNPDPTVSVLWDRVAQQAVIDTDAAPVGPTVASRAYAMVHSAMYDAWASYDATAVRVSFDQEDDNGALFAQALAIGPDNDAEQAKAMSYAAATVLGTLFPDQTELIRTVMEDRLGYCLDDDGSLAARIGLDAADDLLALRAADGSNQAGLYADDTGYAPRNTGPDEIVDITAWTPESVPLDPEGEGPLQSFLTPQWGNVESFALPEDANGVTDFSGLRPPPPQPFFTEAQSRAQLDLAAKTVTLAAPAVIDGVAYAAGATLPTSKALIGPVINPGFIEQAETVLQFSAELNDDGKISAEFFEDGGGTSFPPGTWMTFAQFESARSDHSLDQDALLFFAMGSAVMDAGIATWEAKVFYDYVRPVRAIRELGELGLIGEPGVDEVTGEHGFVVEAFAGVDVETGEGLGSKTILAANWAPFQKPGADPSPPFAEYTSGHSAFSAAGAEVLLRFTGSDAFGGSVDFPAGSIQFQRDVPAEDTSLVWETYSQAADEAGLSRLFGGIHFTEGDVNGRTLGREVGASAYDLAAAFAAGAATDEDRPFFGDDLFV